MLSQQSRARQDWRSSVVFRVFLIGMIGLHGGGCVLTSSRDISVNPAELTGKSHDWFLEHWGTPRARAKRFFGGETWVYSHIDGGAPSMLFFSRAPLECQIHLTFDPAGTLEEVARPDC